MEIGHTFSSLVMTHEASTRETLFEISFARVEERQGE